MEVTLENWQGGGAASALSDQPSSVGAFGASLLVVCSRGLAPARLRVPYDDPFAVPGGEAGTQAPLRSGSDVIGDGVVSRLLATPGCYSAQADDWQVRWELIGVDERSDVSTPPVWIKPAMVGAIPAVQLFVDGGALLDLADGESATARVDITGPSSVGVGASANEDDRQAVQRLRSVFLNGARLDQSAILVHETNATLPEAPGLWRLSYPTIGMDGQPLDGEILAIAPGDIGAAPERVDQTRLVYHGTPLPIGGAETGAGLWFYAPRNHTPTDQHDTVFASPDSTTPSQPIASRPAFQTLTPAATETSITRRRRYEVNRRYERACVLPLGERFVFWQLRSNDPSRTDGYYALPVHDRLTTTTVGLAVTAIGLNRNPDADPDHFADFSLEGVAASRLAWEDNTIEETSFTLSLASIPSSTALLFRHFVPNDTPLNGGVDFQNLEAVELSWTGLPRVDQAGVCRVALGAALDGLPRRVTIGGLDPGTTAGEIVLLDVTDCLAPVQIIGAVAFPDGDGGVALEFEAVAHAATFHLQYLAGVSAPGDVGPAESLPALPATGILDGVCVRPSEFATALAPLVALRGSGMVELDPWAAYNAFNHGQESPEAIRAAVQAIFDAATLRSPIPSVLLAGSGNVDWRNYLGDGEFAPIPPFVEQNDLIYSEGVTVEMATDYRYALLAGADDLPDAMVGRIPARSVDELSTAVARILAQNAACDTLSWQSRRGLFVTDDDPVFLADAPLWTAHWAATTKPTVSIDLTSPIAAQAAIHQCFEGADGGVAFALYLGHGNIRRWDSDVVTVDSVASIDTNGRWPVVAAVTCLNGAYAYPLDEQCLAEAWLFARGDYGAVAAIAPTAVEDYFVVRLFIMELMKGFSANPGFPPDRVGDLLLRAQINCATKYPTRRSMLRQQHLFGDPCVDLTLPTIWGPPGSVVNNWRHYGLN